MNQLIFPSKSSKRLAQLLAIGIMTGGIIPSYSYGVNLSEHNLNFFKNITGKVVDQNGKPLAGVTISIKGSKTATSTDADGTFRLNLPVGNEILVLNFVGYKRLEIPVGNQNVLNIRMEAESQELEEVVAVGYATQKKAHLTGSVVAIKAEEIEDLPSTNVGATLVGRVAGLNVSGGTSRPGAKPSYIIRNPMGGGKDGGTSAPLFVIDGVIQVDGQNQPDQTLFNNLDASEIENISFLKDGAAAVYGVRGANGVVLVTTKKGKLGTPKISYNGSYAINDATYRTKVMDAYQFANYFNIMNGPNGANRDPKAGGFDKWFFSQDELDYFKNHSYNWLDDAWKASYLTRHSLNISGGADKATYFANVAYNKQNGNLGTLDYDRWNFRAGSDIQVASNFKVGMQVSGNTGNQQKTFNKIGGENDDNDYRNLLLASPYVPAYVNGLPVRLPGTAGDLSAYHYFELQKLGNLTKTDSRQFSINLNAEYQAPWLKGLTLRGSYAKNLKNERGDQIGTKYQTYTFDQRSGENGHIFDENISGEKAVTFGNGNRVYFSNATGSNYQANFTATYDKQWKKHNFSGLFSVEKAEAKSSQEDVWKNDPLQNTNGQFGTAFGTVEGRTAAYESGTLGYLGRLNYRYGDKYLAEVLFRSDASTKFAPENYWGKFYNISVGWVISEEDFFHVKGVDYLKLRLSHGKLGNDQTAAWGWKQRYTYQIGKGGVFGGNGDATTGMKMEKTANRNATWANDYKNNIGIDARFFNSRLSATIDGYYNFGRNLLLERTGNVPISVGGSVAAENFAKKNTYGLEFDLGWQDKINEFSYGIGARFSWTNDKILAWNYNEVDMMYPWNPQLNASSDNGAWGYDYLGMFKTQQDIDNYVSQYNITQVFNETADKLRPGMLYYRDVRGALQADGTFAGPDGIINEFDQIQLAKNNTNHYSVGMTLKAGYKGISAEAVITGSFGGYNEITERKPLNNDISRVYTNLPAFWGNVYDPVLNPMGNMPNPNWSDMYDVRSSFWTVPAFQMRMSSFNIGYRFPDKVNKYLKVSNLRAYLSAMNPLTIYNPFSYKDGNGGGWDVYPNLRTYSFGINVTL
ncbi:SusC/RagA family TonB-linked outer membrane protein [Sphingobacterium prati]|uniref:SusC/RagA family TonB-linked outer membrane protein n=1 Tax=Sphingobacterium prati TaxID=2737006 RepID=UPI001556E528|nr:SusC/RagA family TonB-linked outer membrane protein [Sphingobacterium prati]NPE49049.1 SusC/RagA family TonB-linked outer membrane protein [Sphingobacterium prati]